MKEKSYVFDENPFWEEFYKDLWDWNENHTDADWDQDNTDCDWDGIDWEDENDELIWVEE